MSLPTVAQITDALSRVQDPEIHRPITELGMVDDVVISPDGDVRVTVLLTVSGCPMREKLTTDVTAAVAALDGVREVEVVLGVMTAEQRADLQTRLRGGQAEREIPFAQPGSLTRVYGIASGKGGVGKSSVTVNLAAAMAADGLSVGVLDADIYGHSIPRMLGVENKPTKVEDMIMPPQAHGVKVISIGMFVRGNQPVAQRGPMLHRALQQFLTDVYWGDLDVLLLDLPPGTGDIAISFAHLLPAAEVIVVTTPQLAAAEVAERAGALAQSMSQNIVGVVENMAWLDLPDGSRMDLFGSGGGKAVAAALGRIRGAEVPQLGQVPVDVRLREAGDCGVPLVLSDPEAPAAQALRAIAHQLSQRSRGLVGRSLGLTPAGR